MSCTKSIINWFKKLFKGSTPPVEVPVQSVDVVEMPVEETRPTIKHALLVGIDVYNDSRINLSGCVTDVFQMKRVLLARGFKEKDILILTNKWATKENILTELEKIIVSSKSGDEVVFHFSGHGSQVADLDGDEGDNLDEILVPHDMDWNGTYISDDDIARIFKKKPSGVYLSMISDSCHSGTISRDAKLMSKYLTPPAEILQKIFTTKNLKLRPVGLRVDGGVQEHVLLSGCKSTQTSMSVVIDGKWHGVLTYFFTKALNADGTWSEVYDHMFKSIKEMGYAQDPQLTGSNNLLNRKVFGGKNG